MTRIKLSDSEKVAQHIQLLPLSIQPTVEYLRSIILSVDPAIDEHIKWNSPAFYYSGEMKSFDAKEYKRDILVINIRNEKILCVLPTGMSIQKNAEVLEGNYSDGRRMISIKDLEDLRSKESGIINALKEWISIVDK